MSFGRLLHLKMTAHACTICLTLHVNIAAVLKAYTDGAVNQLYQCAELNKDHYIPDFISGDFDSAKEEALSFYKQKVAQALSPVVLVL